MKNTIYTKDQINKAIYDVITHTFKKDCPEAHEIVKDAGYITYRNKGYTVRNPETNREVYTFETDRAWYSHETRIWYSHYSRSAKLTDKFDFVGCLEKKYNPIHNWNGRRYDSVARDKFENLSSAKRMAKYYEKDIENIKTKMLKLQDEMLRAERMRLQYEETVKNYRKQYGLA